MKSRLLIASGPAMTAVAAFLSVSALAIDATAQDTELLFFASDVHSNPNGLFDQVRERCSLGDSVNHCELIGLVGDYNSGDPGVFDSSYADVATNISMGLFMSFDWSMGGVSYNPVFSQGNHDEKNPYFTEGYAPSGPVSLYNNDFYDVYRINYSDFAKPGNVKEGCNNLKRHLETRTDKLLVVLSHLPLHSTRLDRNGQPNQEAATCYFDAMNDAAAAGQDIMFLWGHNHSRPGVSGSEEYDRNVRMVAIPGETVKNGTNNYLNANATKTLNFSYVNAGYTITDPASSTLVWLQQTWMYIIRYSGANAEGYWVTR